MLLLQSDNNKIADCDVNIQSFSHNINISVAQYLTKMNLLPQKKGKISLSDWKASDKCVCVFF